MSYERVRFDSLDDYKDMKIVELEEEFGELDIFDVRTIQAAKSKKDVDKVCKRLRKEINR